MRGISSMYASSMSVYQIPLLWPVFYLVHETCFCEFHPSWVFWRSQLINNCCAFTVSTTFRYIVYAEGSRLWTRATCREVLKVFVISWIYKEYLSLNQPTSNFALFWRPTTAILVFAAERNLQRIYCDGAFSTRTKNSRILYKEISADTKFPPLRFYYLA